MSSSPISLQPATSVLHVGQLCKQSLIFVIYLYNSAHVMVIILFPLSRLEWLAKKDCCHRLSLTLLKSMREKDQNTVKNDSGSQMITVFTIKEINLIISLFCNMLQFHLCLCLRYHVLWLDYLLYFWQSNKSSYDFPKDIYHIPVGTQDIFKQNIFSKISFTTCQVYHFTLIFS